MKIDERISRSTRVEMAACPWWYLPSHHSAVDSGTPWLRFIGHRSEYASLAKKRKTLGALGAG